ncbi:NAD(P)H-dependent flavin oxidoreductase [Pseudogracilibacillus sp. SO30301A]|uniref:NAD(P)H-dependent flavin oxidoreductase n=1 Tax=Pseudogracilibacillus sp. SO30301A TaxID=3098291 RepID=UPI00300DC068
MIENQFTKLFNVEYPIIQAPMAGGITTNSLVSAVSNAGGLGMIGAGYMSPEQLRSQVKELKLQTENFGVNLFVPNDFSLVEHKIQAANEALVSVQEKYKLEKNTSIPTKESFLENYFEQIKVVVEEKIPVCSFTFGVPTKSIMNDLKRAGISTVGTATTVQEAIHIEQLGMDAVVAQGYEAGGHRGSFLKDKQRSIGVMSLVPQIVDHVSIPVIAAGGIMDGRGLAASLCLGAKAVQMGTAFLVTEESGANHIHKEAILQAVEEEIVETRAFSGKYAQGIRNQYIDIMMEFEEDLPEFPIQNALTQPMRKAAAKNKDKGYMSLWAGQSPRLAKYQTVKKLIGDTIFEATKLIK